MNILLKILENGFKELGSGRDGMVYSINDKTVIKLMISDSEPPYRSDECVLGDYFRQNKDLLLYKNLLPKFENIGVIDGTPCIIRENLFDLDFDIDEYYSIHKKHIFSAFLLQFEHIVFNEKFDFDDFVKEWGKTGIDVITINEAIEFAISLIDMLEDGIYPRDFGLPNLGRDSNGQLKIRDFGRFTIDHTNKKLNHMYLNQEYKNNSISINSIKNHFKIDINI